MQEEFRDVEGYEGLYQVSNLGRVKGFKRCSNGKILKLGNNGKGYLQVCLCKKGIKQKSVKVHQLVAITFLNHTHCGHKLVVNHKDFNRLNNNLDNLEIVTARENSNKKHLKSSSQYTGVSWYARLNKWVSQITINGEVTYLGLFINEEEASKAYQNKLLSLDKNEDKR
jgi:hypothetical protein